MAQSSAPTARGPVEQQVAQFGDLAQALTEAAATYAAAGEFDPETDGMIRRLRVITAALSGALIAVPMRPPPSMMPAAVMPTAAPSPPPPGATPPPSSPP